MPYEYNATVDKCKNVLKKPYSRLERSLLFVGNVWTCEKTVEEMLQNVEKILFAPPS